MRLEAAQRPHRDRHRPTRAAAAILVSLTLLTLGGSAAFVFAGAIGLKDVGLAPLALSFVFSANAIAGVPSARYRGARRLSGLWMACTGVAAILVGSLHAPVVFIGALILWGFAYWMSVPGAFSLLVERSAYPDERAGDAQSVMALGRVVGPLLGGLLYEISPTVLGFGAGSVIIAGSLLLLYVEWRIHPDVISNLLPS